MFPEPGMVEGHARGTRSYVRGSQRSVFTAVLHHPSPVVWALLLSIPRLKMRGFAFSLVLGLAPEDCPRARGLCSEASAHIAEATIRHRALHCPRETCRKWYGRQRRSGVAIRPKAVQDTSHSEGGVFTRQRIVADICCKDEQIGGV